MLLTLQLGAALGAASLAAQPMGEVEPTRYSNPTADQLEQAAERLARDPKHYGDAASAYEQAAALRGGADPRSADLLINAARVYHAAGEPSSAIRVLLHLAEQSLASGRVTAAADALIDGAWVARDAGRADAALELARRALMLTDSPLLSPEERTRLRGRLGL